MTAYNSDELAARSEAQRLATRILDDWMGFQELLAKLKNRGYIELKVIEGRLVCISTVFTDERNTESGLPGMSAQDFKDFVNFANAVLYAASSTFDPARPQLTGSDIMRAVKGF